MIYDAYSGAMVSVVQLRGLFRAYCEGCFSAKALWFCDFEDIVFSVCAKADLPISLRLAKVYGMVWEYIHYPMQFEGIVDMRAEIDSELHAIFAMCREECLRDESTDFDGCMDEE